MALSNDLISQFVKATRDKEQINKESTAYGKIVVHDGKEYVQLDGSELLTPISSTIIVKEGDRVTIIKAKLSNEPYEKDGEKRSAFKLCQC